MVVRVSNVGRSLREVITSTPSGFDAPDVVRVVTELVEALDPMHKMTPPMVHRALCPESIWWDDTSDGSVLLTDWAVAKLLVGDQLLLLLLINNKNKRIKR